VWGWGTALSDHFLIWQPSVDRELVIHQHRKTCIAWFNEVMLQKSHNATDCLKGLEDGYSCVNVIKTNLCGGME
jgi:hypothetical protein